MMINNFTKKSLAFALCALLASSSISFSAQAAVPQVVEKAINNPMTKKAAIAIAATAATLVVWGIWKFCNKKPVENPVLRYKDFSLEEFISKKTLLEKMAYLKKYIYYLIEDGIIGGPAAKSMTVIDPKNNVAIATTPCPGYGLGAEIQKLKSPLTATLQTLGIMWALVSIIMSTKAACDKPNDFIAELKKPENIYKPIIAAASKAIVG